LEVDVHDFNRA